MIPRFMLVLVLGSLFIPNARAQSAGNPRLDALGDPLPEGASARIGTLRFKHSPGSNVTIVDVVFSPDGKKIASLAGDGSMRLWDADSGKEIKGPWHALNNSPNAPYMMFSFSPVAFSPDGKLLAAAINPRSRFNNGNGNAMRETIIIYDIAAGTRLKGLSAQQQVVSSLRFADGGKKLVAAGDGVARWWDVATGKEERSWKPFASEPTKADPNGPKTKTFSHCEISPDAKFIAVQVDWRNNNVNGGIIHQSGRSGSVAKEVIGYELATGKKYWQSAGKGPQYGKCYFAFSADGKRLAVAIGPDKVELRDGVTGKLQRDPLESKLTGNNGLGGLALSSDGATVAWAGNDSTVQIVSTAEAGPARQFMARLAQNGPNATACLCFSPDNKRLALGVDADLQLYDVGTLQEVRPWEGHRGWIDHLAFTPDGKRLLTGSGGRGPSTGDYFGPNGEVYYLVTFSGKGGTPAPEVAAWDVATWKRSQLTSVRTPPWPNFGSTSLQQTVYVGKTGDERYNLYDMKTGQLTARMRLPEKPYTAGSGFFSPGGKHYVQYANDNKGNQTERLYAVPSGKLVCQLPPLASNPNRGAILLNNPGDVSNNMAFSRDEKLVAQFARGDGLIYVFETATGKLRHSLGMKLEFDENRGFVFYHYDVAFSSDGKYLASWTSMDKAIRVWDLASGTEMSRIVLEDAVPNNYYPGMLGAQGRFQLAWSPDNRLLAAGESKITLWELATLGARRKLPGHAEGYLRAMAFSPDGQVLATASSDTTVLIWDMTPADRPPLAAGALDEGGLEKRWQTLALDDAAQGFAAILDLAAAPKESVTWISTHVKPADPVDPRHVVKLIGDLNDNQFKVRQSATAELLQIGDRVVPAIDQALAAKPALETHLRLQDVRKRVTSLVLKGEKLRTFRALEVLEKIGSPPARQALQRLADGAPGAPVTVHAQAALLRLQRNEGSAVAQSR